MGSTDEEQSPKPPEGEDRRKHPTGRSPLELDEQADTEKEREASDSLSVDKNLAEEIDQVAQFGRGDGMTKEFEICGSGEIRHVYEEDAKERKCPNDVDGGDPLVGLDWIELGFQHGTSCFRIRLSLDWI